ELPQGVVVERRRRRRPGLDFLPRRKDAVDGDGHLGNGGLCPGRWRFPARGYACGEIPQVVVTDAPGSSTMSPSPLRNAFGAQVIGSTASPRRWTSGWSPVNTIRYGYPSSTQRGPRGPPSGVV